MQGKTVVSLKNKLAQIRLYQPQEMYIASEIQQELTHVESEDVPPNLCSLRALSTLG